MHVRSRPSALDHTQGASSSGQPGGASTAAGAPGSAAGSPVAGRLDRLLAQGWVEGTPAPADSWCVVLTRVGHQRFEDALPYAEAALRRLDETLTDAGVDLPALRRDLTTMSSVVRSLL